MRRYFSEFHIRYVNCRYWSESKRHSFFNALFRPSHANKNLHPYD